MNTQNGYIHIKAKSDSVFSGISGNEYETVDSPSKIIIVEEQFIVAVVIDGEENYFVREENIIATKDISESLSANSS